MPFNALSGCVQVRFNQSFRDQQCINSLWFFDNAGLPTVSDVTNLAFQCESAWAANVMPLLSSDLKLLNVVARDFTTESGIEVLSSSGVVFGGAGDAMPNNVAACVSLRTPFAGRHYRGRLYLGGIPRTAIVENDYTSAFTGTVLDALNTYFVGVGTVSANYTLSIVAREAAGVPIAGGLVTEVNQFIFSDNIVDSQQRRLPGRGK